jgi:hypothetical protein
MLGISLVKLQTKLRTYSTTLSESAGLFTNIGFLLVAFASSKFIFELMQYLVINSAYGHAAWVSGLRVSDWRHGDLSDGDVLAGWPYVVFYLGGFILWGLFCIGSLFLFSYIGLRLRGRRLSDPKPKKKKWRSSSESNHAA